MDREVQQSAREREAPHHKTEEPSLCLQVPEEAAEELQDAVREEGRAEELQV